MILAILLLSTYYEGNLHSCSGLFCLKWFCCVLIGPCVRMIARSREVHVADPKETTHGVCGRLIFVP